MAQPAGKDKFHAARDSAVEVYELHGDLRPVRGFRRGRKNFGAIERAAVETKSSDFPSNGKAGAHTASDT